MYLSSLAFVLFVAIAAAALHFRLSAENRPSSTYIRFLVLASLAGALAGFLVAIAYCIWRWGDEPIDEDMRVDDWICGIAAWTGGAIAVMIVHIHARSTSPTRVRDRQLIADDYQD
jgi:hypothetical protein